MIGKLGLGVCVPRLELTGISHKRDRQGGGVFQSDSMMPDGSSGNSVNRAAESFVIGIARFVASKLVLCEDMCGISKNRRAEKPTTRAHASNR